MAEFFASVHLCFIQYTGLGKDRIMKSRVLDACLTILGIAGLMVYVLACAPSFSPDGKKVAFPVLDYDNEQTSVFVYDINKNKFETVAEFKDPNHGGDSDDDMDIAYSVQWMPDGKQILINGASLIMILPVESEGPTRTFQPQEDMKFLNILPPPIVGNYQFIVNPDKPELYRVNVQNWETQSFQLAFSQDDLGIPFSDGEQLYFTVDLEKEDQKFCSIMKLNVENGAYTPVAQINMEECDELQAWSWLKLGGDRFAAISKYQDRVHLVLVQGNSIEKMIPIGEKRSGMNIGNLVPSRDGRSIFAAFSYHDQLDQFGVMEIPFDGGETREMVLFAGDGPMDDQINPIAFHIALSPDGRKIAASSVSGLEYTSLKPEDRALYFIDVGHPEWKVNKVRVPLTSASNKIAVER